MQQALPESCRESYVRRREDLSLAAVHQAGFDGITVVVADEVEGAVGHEKLKLEIEGDAEPARLAPGGVHGDHDLAHEASVRLGDLQWKGQDIGPPAYAAECPIEPPDLRVVHERDLDDASLAARRA